MAQGIQPLTRTSTHEQAREDMPIHVVLVFKKRGALLSL
jgi:hypothetical protein